MAGPLGGGGETGVPLRKKRTFFNVRNKFPMATKPSEVKAKGLSGIEPLRKELFFAPLNHHLFCQTQIVGGVCIHFSSYNFKSLI